MLSRLCLGTRIIATSRIYPSNFVGNCRQRCGNRRNYHPHGLCAQFWPQQPAVALLTRQMLQNWQSLKIRQRRCVRILQPLRRWCYNGQHRCNFAFGMGRFVKRKERRYEPGSSKKRRCLCLQMVVVLTVAQIISKGIRCWHGNILRAIGLFISHLRLK